MSIVLNFVSINFVVCNLTKKMPFFHLKVSIARTNIHNFCEEVFFTYPLEIVNIFFSFFSEKVEEPLYLKSIWYSSFGRVLLRIFLSFVSPSTGKRGEGFSTLLGTSLVICNIFIALALHRQKLSRLQSEDLRTCSVLFLFDFLLQYFCGFNQQKFQRISSEIH